MGRTAMTAPWSLDTAGQLVTVHDDRGGYDTTLRMAAGLGLDGNQGVMRSDVNLFFESERHGFDRAGFQPVTRGVWADGEGDVIIDSAGGSGFSQLWSVRERGLRVRTRWSPSTNERLAAVALRARFAALRAQVLLHYPVLWWAAVHGLAPLHVSVVDIDGVAVLLAGPGGVGKSTLVARELFIGARATCDNIAASDGERAHGLSEPLRVPADLVIPPSVAPTTVPYDRKQRVTHGRSERAWVKRAPSFRPDVVVVVRRGVDFGPGVREISPELASRFLVAGTFCAGELRRFWPQAAALSLATGRGPALAPVEAVADKLTSRLPCYQLELGTNRSDDPGYLLRTLLGPSLLTQAHREACKRADRERPGILAQRVPQPGPQAGPQPGPRRVVVDRPAAEARPAETRLAPVPKKGARR
jgi:hypothetical protein